MGCGSSKIPATSLPPQQPYSGWPVEYHYLNIEATVDVNKKFSFTKTNVTFQSTNTDSYFHQLESLYARGYRMLAFFSLQDSTAYGYASRHPSRMKVKFHGIFRKGFPDESRQQWELKVDKSVMVNQMFQKWSGILRTNVRTDSSSNSYHVIQTINDVAQRGGRLVTVELSGTAGEELGVQRQIETRRGVLSRTVDTPAAQVSVDVFYEMPYPSMTEKYVYQIVNCPMNSFYKHKYPRGQFHSTIEWQKIMADYLGKGWRLVDIFEDHSVSANTQTSGFSATVDMCKNCLWIFEKPESSMNSNTPQYEGTMVEHYFKTVMEARAMGFGGARMNVTADFEPVLNHMGKYGWEVVRILSTPDFIIKPGFKPEVHTKQLIFFQRKIEESMGDSSLLFPYK